MAPVIQAIAEGCEVLTLTDRDRYSAAEREKARQEGCLILKRRELENYLLDDEVLRLLCEEVGRLAAFGELISLRDDNIANIMVAGDVRSSKAKNAAAKIYEAAESLLGIQYPGESYEPFLVEYLALLITPDTAIYKELKTDIFGE